MDDSTESRIALKLILKSLDLNILEAVSGEDALALTLVHDFALVILDVQMPGMDGYETAQLIREHVITGHIPIIFLSGAYTDQEHVFKEYETGAVDYLLKPSHPNILRSKVDTFVRLHNRKISLAEINEQLRQEIRNRNHVEEKNRHQN